MIFATFKPKKAEAFRLKHLFQVFAVNVVLQFTSQCQKVHECIMSYPDYNFSISQINISTFVLYLPQPLASLHYVKHSC